MLELWVYLVFTAIPLYIANSSAMIFGGKTPIDFNQKWADGNSIFGKGKTWKGACMGILMGWFAGLLLWYFFPSFTGKILADYVPYAFLLALGTILGDMGGSFVKRRMDMKRGAFFPMLDQLDFITGGLLFGLIVFIPVWWHALLLIIITPVLHLLFNIVAYLLKIKQVPW
jgi:CDP-2,3-bis-(O-geranylgeranyl)-sn-glycerol synthase